MASPTYITLDDTELRTVAVDGSADGTVCLITRRLDAKSVLSIVDENKVKPLVLVGKEVRTSGPIGSSIHNLVVRESFGLLAMEYPIMVAGYLPSVNGGVVVNPSKPTPTVNKSAKICFADNKQTPLPGWNCFKLLTGTDKNLNANKKIDLVSAEGVATGWSATLDNAQGVSNQGKTTGKDSGVFPDQVIGWYAYNGDSVGGSNGGSGIPASTVTISGLDPNTAYNIKIFASRSLSDRATVYTIGSKSVILDTSNNVSRTADFVKIEPDDDGTISIKWERKNSQSYGHLSAISIVEL